MDECITKEMTKSLLKAFEGMNESLEDFQKACASTIESTEKHIVSALDVYKRQAPSFSPHP